MEWLSQYKQDIDKAIETFFDEHYHRDNASEQEKKLQTAVRYAVNSGNSPRMHPILAMVVYEEVLGLTADTALPVFIGLEFIHIGLSLHAEAVGIEDDKVIEGNISFRKKYGESMTILVGDALISMGTECLTKGGKMNLVEEALHAIDDSGIIRGMTRDILVDHTNITEGEYIAMHDEETSRLLASSFVIGAYFASAAPEVLIDQLRRYAVFLSRIYLVKKDIIAYEARSTVADEHTEKSVIDFLGIEKAKALFDNLEFELLKMTRNFQSTKFADLIEIFKEGKI